jgi:hypothetical protein
MASFGQTLRLLDADSRGNDDVIGQVLQMSGNAVQAFANSDDKGFRKYLKLIADSINEFLSSST